MANKKKKTNNLIKAVEKQADKQRQALLDNVAATKNEALLKSEEYSKKFADKYIDKQLEIETANIKSEYAVKSLQSQGNLFKTRDNIINDVFNKAKDKLIAYTRNAEYKDTLLTYAKEISDAFNNEKCIVYIKEEDMKFAEDIRDIFNSEIEIKTDKSIVIGGIKGYCENLKIVADNTLDSKLAEEKAKFIKTSNLKIV